MTHKKFVINVSALYLVLLVLMRITTETTSESHRHVYHIVDYANELYDQMNTTTNATQRLRFANMCISLYTMLLEVENVSRTVIDRIAKCDVHRRRRRLQRIVETLSVPTKGTASVSSM